jgi:hypothetical protein
MELFLNTFARWPDDHPKLVTILYDDTTASVTLYDPVIDVIRSRDGEAARTIARRALEALDTAWSRRHPPPPPVIAEPANEAGQGPAAPAKTSAPTPARNAKTDGGTKR